MKKRNKMRLSQVSLLVTAISIASFSFAADTANKDSTKPAAATAVNKDINNGDLSDLRKQIVAEDLKSKLADKKLDTKKKEKEIESLQYQIDNPQSTVVNPNIKQLNQVVDPGMIAVKEDQIAKDKNMSQVVGFKYQQDEKPDGGAEVSGMLKELDQMIGKDGATAASPFVVQKSFLEVKLDSLSIVGNEKKAKVKFIFVETTGLQKRKLAHLINAEEGKEIQVNDKKFMFKSITPEGVEVVDLGTNEILLASRFR